MSEIVDETADERFMLEEDGIGGRLVRAALTRARRDQLTIVPNCPFARSWLEKHRDELDGVTIDW